MGEHYIQECEDIEHCLGVSHREAYRLKMHQVSQPRYCIERQTCELTNEPPCCRGGFFCLFVSIILSVDTKIFAIFGRRDPSKMG